MLDNLLAAAAQFQPMTEIPFLNSKLTGEAGDASAVFNALFKLAITIGAMLAVFMFIWGGLQMITARDSAGSVGAGKTKMTNAIMGLLMLISTFVVLNTINPQLTSLALFKGANGEDISRLEAAPRSRSKQGQQALKNLGAEVNYNFSNKNLTTEQKDRLCDSVNKASSGGVVLEPVDSGGYCQNVWAPRQRTEKFGKITTTSFPKGICGNTWFGGNITGNYSCGYKSINTCIQDGNQKKSCKIYTGQYALISTLNENNITTHTISSIYDSYDDCSRARTGSKVCWDIDKKCSQGTSVGETCNTNTY